MELTFHGELFVRRAENIDDGDVVDVEMTVKGPSRSVTTPVRT